jgi:hypothetical protein
MGASLYNRILDKAEDYLIALLSYRILDKADDAFLCCLRGLFLSDFFFWL